ncbi:MAG: hypothetical protein FJY29_02115 [Betaproteobacteria bacterium]|nr:hypothetical protein [Betaproteobacteria bacterium]
MQAPQKNQRRQLGILSGLLAVVAFSGCKPRSYNSGVYEAPGNADRPERLGLPATMPWSELKDLKAAERSVPWTDTYWPLFQKGMAVRWAVPEGGATALPKNPETPWRQVSQMLEAWNQGDKARLNLLSPAEKYELIKLGDASVNASLLAELEANEKQFLSAPGLKESRDRLEAIAKQQQQMKLQIDQLSREINALVSKVRDDNASGLKLKGFLKDPALRNRVNREEVLQQISVLQNAVVNNIAGIKAKQTALDNLETQAKDFNKKKSEAKEVYDKELKTWQKSGLAVAGKMSDSLNMISTSWENYLNYSSSYDEPWEWMGHCHGWAVAALNEATPKHGVLVQRAGKEIFFTEGDIRGLLTKVYSDQSPPAKFASLRCDSDKLVKDRLGRVADGKLCLGENKKSCTQTDKGEIVYIATGQSQRGLSVIGSKVNDDNPRVAVWTGGGTEDSVQVAIYPDLDTFSKNLSKIRARDYSGSQRGILNISLSCRDTNPMTLHMALKGFIADKKIGFVMDRTRTAQVWNQPVHKFEIATLPIKKNDKDGTLSVPGEPVAVAEVDDLFRDFRAKGTAFLVQMKVKLHYGVENGPRLTYRAPDEATDVDTVVYTLELDAKQNLIGGEWGLIPTTENAKDSSLAAGRSGAGPDFLWLIDQKEKPIKGKLDHALIDKIHRCSLEANNIQKYPWSVGGVTLDYTICKVD